MTASRTWAALAAVAGLVAVLAVVSPALGGGALGGPLGEGPAHLWGLWTTAASLPGGSPFLRVADAGFPNGFRADLMDPVHLVVVAPLVAIAGDTGATLGWNLLPALSLSLGGLGGWWLGARLGLHPAARAVLAGLLAASPYVCGAVVPVGRSEQLAGAWLALHLATLHGAVRDGGWRWGAAAVATLALQAHAGWRPLMFLLLVEVPVTLAWVAGSERRVAALCRAIAVGAAAAALTVPMLVAHLSTSPWWASSTWASPFQVPGEATYLVDLLPGRPLPSWQGDPPANVGLVALLAAGAAAARQPRRVLPWLGFGLGLWVLALGTRVGWSSASGFGWGPAAYLAWLVAPLRAIQGWPRLAPLALVPLAIAAALGVQALEGRRRAIAAGVVLLLGTAEGLAWRPLGRPTFPVGVVSPGADTLAALPPGALLELPLDLPQVDAAVQGRIDAALLAQRLHGRPTSLTPSPHRPTAHALAGPLGAAGRPGPPLDCEPELLRRLGAAGVGGVVLHLDWLDPRGAQMTLDAVRAQLGEPDVRSEASAVWAIAADRPSGCVRAEAAGVGEVPRR